MPSAAPPPAAAAQLPLGPTNPPPTVGLVQAGGPFTADAVVVATRSTASGVVLAAGAEGVDAALSGRLRSALQALEASGRSDEVVKVATLGQLPAPLVIAAGLGNSDVNDYEAVRRAVGAVFRGLNSAKRVAIAVGAAKDPELVAAIADGVLLGSYRFNRFKSAAKAPALKRVDIAVAGGPDTASRAALRRARIAVEAVNQVRDLVNTPPNVLNPPSFAHYAAQRGDQAGLTVEVLDEKALSKGRFGGILAVGAGSISPPRLVRLTYRPARPRARVALVGKGITFDTGGLDLKTTLMAQMKSDMAGAAAVIEATIAAARLGLPVEVVATVPMAENSVSGSSYRPSDVLTMYNGTTVEVDNTDAEGRLVLADAISRAAEDDPEYLIETSTLTGGQMVALGVHTTGAMGSAEFRDRVVAAGVRAGEAIWPMPLPAHLVPSLDSAVADLQNLPKDRWASMLVGGTFLAKFVPDGLQWVHLDIAGPSFLTSPSGYNGKGGTGVIVRTILATLEDLAAGTGSV